MSFTEIVKVPLVRSQSLEVLFNVIVSLLIVKPVIVCIELRVAAAPLMFR